MTGILGGYLFGEWGGVLYSTIGLTVGSVVAFGVGRWLGARYVQKLVSADIWRRMGFIVEAEGVILCFIIFLMPGLPKDVTCYLFGLSPMPFWVFAVVSTLGRFPSTWVLSAQGARTESGDYLQLILLTAVVVAVALPLYYYRNRVVEWLRGKRVRSADRLANETNAENGARAHSFLVWIDRSLPSSASMGPPAARRGLGGNGARLAGAFTTRCAGEPRAGAARASVVSPR